ncbi:MAG: molybdopterin molybdotransferase MoeA [Thermoplasmata archaeon]|nr:molybdopterin molybdotransferase MoeA [Thermoplasmata archaeon]MCI4359252.1 molybdopterin molybdotransferase MoeA [Thermoplasmata archaeon]
MRPFRRLLPWGEALRRLERDVRPVGRRERVPVAHAVGRVAAREYRARSAVPPFDRATWDGYALRSRSTRGAGRVAPLRLSVVGEVFAEGDFRGSVGANQAVAIATGGALPRGADAVVLFEDVTEEERAIRVHAPVPRGDHIARAGEDLQRGSVIVDRGAVLAPADLGALSITGWPDVEVWARPVVTIVPNGNELVIPGRRLRRGAIYESNNATLSALIEASGGVARTTTPVRDDPRQIESAIRRAIRASDLVLVTGGSSVGERDFLPEVFPKLGRLRFHGIAIRPGKPTLAVRSGGVVVIGMPGHPTSCLSNGFWLLLPLLRRLAHLPGDGWRDTPVRLTGPVELPTSGFATVIPLKVRGARATPTFRGSSAIASLGGANAFALWPPGAPAPGRGRRLEAHVLRPPLGPA